MQGRVVWGPEDCLNKMGQCFAGRRSAGPKDNEKQDKNIDDKRMFKLGVDILNRDFCIQIGYNRKAVKTYGKGNPVGPLPEKVSGPAIPEDVVS